MAKEKKRYCSICSEEISVPFGLFYHDTYCCNCGTMPHFAFETKC